MFKYLLFLALSISVNGCALSNKSTKNKPKKEVTLSKSTKFTAKMIKEVQERRAKFLKNRQKSK